MLEQAPFIQGCAVVLGEQVQFSFFHNYCKLAAKSNDSMGIKCQNFLDTLCADAYSCSSEMRESFAANGCQSPL